MQCLEHILKSQTNVLGKRNMVQQPICKFNDMGLSLLNCFLQKEILKLSQEYVRALAQENADIVDGPYAGRFTAFGKIC